jgi:branched-chain amino acid transport system permease protein
MTYLLHIAIYIEIYAILAMSLNLIVGYSGLLSLCHSAYFALGAYTYAVLNVSYGVGFLASSCVGAVFAATLSLALSLAAWRLKGDLFALASLSIQATVYSTLSNWYSPTAPLGSWLNLTNGTLGISAVRKPDWAGIQTDEITYFFTFCSIIALACAYVFMTLERSNWQKVLLAIRDDDLAMRAVGKFTPMIVGYSIALSCVFAQVAGALFAAHLSYIDPSIASLDESVLILSMVLVGGAGSWLGAVLGSSFLIVLPEMLRMVQFPSQHINSTRLLLVGIILIALMRFQPHGFLGRRKI